METTSRNTIRCREVRVKSESIRVVKFNFRNIDKFHNKLHQDKSLRKPENFDTRKAQQA